MSAALIRRQGFRGRGDGMSETYWKAVRPDGTDFWTGTVRWLPKTPLKRPHTVRHPSSTCAVREDHSTSLAVSTDPTNLPGALWPMRLCRVEQVEDIIITDAYKRQSVAWRVVEEVDPAIRFGPQGPHVGALVARARVITAGEAERLVAASDAALALVVRDLIGQHGFTQAHYDTFTLPWRTVIGPIHPDDSAVSA